MPIRVRVTHWHGVAIWKWKVKEEDCGICRQPFDGTCPKCKMPGDECPPVWGNCNHHFHMHCIMKWLQQQRAQDRCPLCRQLWEIKVNDDNNQYNQQNNNNHNDDDDDDDDDNNQLNHNNRSQSQSQRLGVRRVLQLDS